MAQKDFGQLLREARERKGYDLPTAARRLRIRPDVLRAIESCDYENMPPRGYARNMVNAYARFVGLNPTEIVRMYLDGAYEYRGAMQAGQGSSSSGFDMPDSRIGRAGQGSARHSSQDRFGRGDVADGRTARSSARTSRMDDPADPFADRGTARTERSSHRYDSSQRRTSSRQRGTRADQDGYRSQAGGLGGLSLSGPGRQKTSLRRNNSDSSGMPLYPGMYSAPAPSVLQGKLPFIIAAVVILILLVVLVSLLSGNGKAEEEDVPSVPVTGLTDTTVENGSDAATPAPVPVETEPVKAEFSYKVADGQEAYVEIYIDDEENPSTAEVLAGPVEESIDVTGTLRFVTSAPDAVSLTLDGETLELAEVSEGTGVYDCTVDFSKVLAEWRADHPEAASASSSGDAESSSTASSTDENAASNDAASDAAA